MIPKKSRRSVSQMPLAEANLAYLVCGSLRVLPFWAEKHLSPNSPTYTAPLGGHCFGNTAHRSWTTLRLPDSHEHLTVDPVGMCSPNTTWSLDIWVMQSGTFFSLGTMPLVEQRSVGDVIVVCATLPHVRITLEIGIQAKPTPAGYVGIRVSENTAPLSLFLAIRPYGVSDVSPIRDITYLSEGAMMVNKHLGLVLSEPPQNILCLPFSEGDTAHHIGRWEQLLKATCPNACATGFVEYRLSQTNAQLHAWLPLGNQLSFAQDLLKPLEQSQLKTWIQGFKTRTGVLPSQEHRTQPYPLSARLETVQRHLHQRPLSADIDPWGWTIPLGLLAWTKAGTPEYTQITHVAITENATRLKNNPLPVTACAALSFYDHIGEPPPKDLLQKCIKVVLSVPILTQNLPDKYPHNPLDHRFGEGPYFVDYLYAWKALSLAIGMSQNPQKDQLQQHLSRFERGLNTTLERWAQEKRVSPMLPLTPTRWEEAGIVTGLLAVFPLALIGITDARIANTLMTLQQCIYAHTGKRETSLTDNTTVSEHPTRDAETDLLFTRDKGYPVVENLLLAMVYRLQNDMRCKEILSWALAHLSPTGTLPQNIHPISHMGSHGTGHYLPASGLFLILFRHALVHESPNGYHFFHMLPEACWQSSWDFEVPLSEGTVTMTYIGETRTVSLKNNTSGNLPCLCHPPKTMWISEELLHFVVEAGGTRTLSFETAAQDDV